MKLVELLASERVLVPLRAETLPDAAQQLAGTMVQSGVAADSLELESLLAEFDAKDAVALGQQAFLIHFRTDAVNALAVSLGVAAGPVYREIESSRGARIVALVVAPHREASAYLRAVSALARAVSQPDVITALLAAESPADILAAPALLSIDMPGHLTVGDVMNRARLSVLPDATLGDAVRLLVVHHVSVLSVVAQGGEVLGVLTHREVLRHLLPQYVKKVNTGDFPAAARRAAPRADPLRLPVRDAMDRSVLCLSEDQTLADVAAMMVNKDIEQFPVVSDGVFVGVLTRADIVRRLFGP